MKYLKDTKIGYYTMGGRYQDEWGTWHSGKLVHVKDLWAHFVGVEYEAKFGSRAWWDKPIFKITIERPKSFEPKLHDYIKHRGKFYQIKHVNELTGREGRDMKLVCEYDSSVTAE